VVQAGKGQRRAETAPLGGGIDANDVHLAEIGAVHLRPVEPEQSVIIGVERQEQALGVEPGLGASLGDIGLGPAALLGMPGERRVVDAQQLGVVVRTRVGAHKHPGRHGHLGEIGQRASHLQ
jgi:hypothetical protein